MLDSCGRFTCAFYLFIINLCWYGNFPSRYGHTDAGRIIVQKTGAASGHNPFTQQQQQNNEQPFFSIWKPDGFTIHYNLFLSCVRFQSNYWFYSRPFSLAPSRASAYLIFQLCVKFHLLTYAQDNFNCNPSCKMWLDICSCIASGCVYYKVQVCW